MTGDPIVLEVVGIPYPQGNKSAVLRGGKARTIEGKSSGARASLAAWRGAVADAARNWVYTNHALPVAEPCRVSIVFRFAPPAGDRYRTLHATRPDVDKLARSTFDSLVHGGLLGDDSYVCSLVTEKRYACVGESVGATVEVEPLGWYEAQQREVKKVEALAARRRARLAGMVAAGGADTNESVA